MSLPPPLPTTEECLEMRRLCANFQLRRAARQLTGAYDRHLAGVGLTAAQLPILAALRAGAGSSVGRLASVLDLDHSTLSRNLALLARKRLVRLQVGEDRRSRSVEMTASGEEALARGFRRWREVQDALEQAIPRQRLDAGFGFVRDLVTATGAEPPADEG
ncbi:MAG TPA: MarR family winged helix-turn-helix transcriptional regulator [Thermoanaerobaculia bacterium]|nr:MarR family winged helix-turn-helix transcriptional regulator [Thermoanaerobaculia bacterium]